MFRPCSIPASILSDQHPQEDFDEKMALKFLQVFCIGIPTGGRTCTLLLVPAYYCTVGTFFLHGNYITVNRFCAQKCTELKWNTVEPPDMDTFGTRKNCPDY